MAEDPGVISSIAVHADDVVTALEANEREQGDDRERSVLRITPPYSGRMRARLHREGHEEYDPAAGPIHVPPAQLIDSPPAFPTPDVTEDELREDPERTYSREAHREYHEQRVSDWRTAVRAQMTELVTLETTQGTVDVTVIVLGASDG